MGKAWKIGSHAFSLVWRLFPLDSYPVVCIIMWGMHGFSHHFPITWKRQEWEKSIEEKSLGNWFPETPTEHNM